MKNSESSLWDRVFKPWWGKILIGVLILGGAAFIYFQFAQLESGETQSIRVNSALGGLYQIGGKWLPSGLMGVIGLGMIGWGLAQRIRGSE